MNPHWNCRTLVEAGLVGRRGRRRSTESLCCYVRCRVVEARLEMMSRLAGAGDRYEMGSWTELVGMEKMGIGG